MGKAVFFGLSAFCGQGAFHLSSCAWEMWSMEKMGSNVDLVVTDPSDVGGIEELWKASATGLSALLEANEISPVEVLDSILARVEEVDGTINAFRCVDREGALEQARAAEKRLRSGERLGALDGIPVHVKDNIFVKGLPCGWGSRLYADHVAENDDYCVRALRRNGAVIFGKTNTPEFSLLSKTHSRLTGVTRNPWNLACTPGGSSGGCAAAVASGQGPLGIGTDAGGSIRRPASYCGVVGLKTSLGVVKREHGFPAVMHDFQTIGVMARTVSDARLLFAHIGAQGVQKPLNEPAQVRIHILDVESEVLDPDVRDNFSRVAAMVEGMGLNVSRIGFPWRMEGLNRLRDIFVSRSLHELSLSFDPNVWRTEVSERLQETALRGSSVSAEHYDAAVRELAAFRKSVDSYMGPDDILLTPTSPFCAWHLEDDFPVVVGGSPVDGRHGARYVLGVNAAGLPAISIPTGMSRCGLPIGTQIIGSVGSEGTLCVSIR